MTAIPKMHSVGQTVVLHVCSITFVSHIGKTYFIFPIFKIILKQRATFEASLAP